MEAQSSLEDVFGPVIYSYSRAQAIEDGVLVDVSETAREAGFTWPVAMTIGAWVETVSNKPELKGIQDEGGKLWDVMWMCSLAARKGGTEMAFSVMVRYGRKEREMRKVDLRAVAGPGDDAEPVITIMLPDED